MEGQGKKRMFGVWWCHFTSCWKGIIQNVELRQDLGAQTSFITDDKSEA